MYEICKKLSLPKGAELWTYGDLAIKGAGKTYAACVMAEEFVKAGVPIIAIMLLESGGVSASESTGTMGFRSWSSEASTGTSQSPRNRKRESSRSMKRS